MVKRASLLLAALVLISLPARAQLLWVTGMYRVVSLDTENHRIGITLNDAPISARRQNWAYLNLDTQMFVKKYDAEGWSKDEEVPPQDILKSLKVGDRVLINGGRAFDLSITARKIWFDPREQPPQP